MADTLSKNDKIFSSLNQYFGVENTKWDEPNDVCWEEEETKDPVSRILNTSEKYGRKYGQKGGTFLIKVFGFILRISKKVFSIIVSIKQQLMAQVPKIKKQSEEIIREMKKSPILKKVQKMSSDKNEIPVEKVKQVQNRFQQAFKSYLNQNEKVEETPKPRKYFGGLYS